MPMNSRELIMGYEVHTPLHANSAVFSDCSGVTSA